MTRIKQIYKCNICQNITEVIRAGKGTLVCCGKPMELLKEKNQEKGWEKHLPVIEKKENKIKIKIGQNPHPMEDKHFIEWVEIITDKNIYRRFLNPQDEPKTELNIEGDIIKVRSYCNLHGLWSNNQ